VERGGGFDGDETVFGGAGALGAGAPKRGLEADLSGSEESLIPISAFYRRMVCMVKVRREI